MSKNFHLLIPGLLPVTQFRFEQSFPNLSQLLSKAQVKNQAHWSLESQLIQMFNLAQSTLPVGALCALYHNIIERSETNAYFCQADPIHTRLDAHTAFLVQTLYSELEASKVAEIQLMLNSHLFERDYYLHCQANSWFCALPKAEDLSTNPVWDVLGKSLHCRLPSGPDAATYQRLVTECEMLLSTQSFDCEINSLWFWGFGSLPPNAHTDFNVVLTNEVSVKGLAKCANVHYADLPNRPSLDFPGNNILLIDTSLLRAQSQGNIDEWMSLIQWYEQGWISLLLQGLRTGQLSTITLDFGQNIYYKINKQNLRYFWRKVKSLEKFI